VALKIVGVLAEAEAEATQNNQLYNNHRHTIPIIVGSGGGQTTAGVGTTAFGTTANGGSGGFNAPSTSVGGLEVLVVLVEVAAVQTS
jgi:hypothetical protein